MVAGKQSASSESFSQGGGNEISHTTRAILVKNKKSPGPKGPSDWRDSIMKSIVS